MKDFLTPDPAWERTLWGRLSQFRRELSVVLRKDVTVEKLAELVDLSGPTMTGWKRGSQPKKHHLEAVERLAVKVGLPRYSARYLDYGPEGNQLSKAPPVRLRKTSSKTDNAKHG